jgi:hypothetical protein
MPNRVSVQPNYLDPTGAGDVTEALRVLGLTVCAAYRLLGNRPGASESAIKSWRVGRRRPPQWAMELLADAIQAKATELTSLESRIRAIGGPGRYQYNGALGRWRAHRAAQKEKARI